MMKKFLHLVFTSLLFTQLPAQKWVAGPQLPSNPVDAALYAGNIYFIAEQDGKDALYRFGETEQKKLGEISEHSKQSIPWAMCGTSIGLFFHNANSLLMCYDGSGIKKISPRDTLKNIYAAFSHDKKLYLLGKSKKRNQNCVLSFDSLEWETSDVPNESEYGNFFTYKGALYLSYSKNGDELHIMKLTNGDWREIAMKRSECSVPIACAEFREMEYIFYGTNDLYFIFNGTLLVDAVWKLKFDNYGSSEFILHPYKNELYLAGRYWCDVKNATDIIKFDGKKWKSTGPGLESDQAEPEIRALLEYNGQLYAFGEVGSQEKGFKYCAKYITK